MVETSCQCGASFVAAEDAIGQSHICSQCSAILTLVSAEQMGEGNGAGDFDAHLIVESGPDRQGEQILLGGVNEISIGKQSDKNIVLPGTMVSRFHCKLVRQDFGPSQWELHDNRSTNGLFANEQRVAQHPLEHGDTIRVGEYTLKYLIAAEQVKAAPATVQTGVICPSCGQSLPKGTKICVQCGIDIKTGRSLVISKGLDENDLAIRADTWSRILSIFIPIGLFPIASEAFGGVKPRATWTIFIVTVVASVLFLIGMIAQRKDEHPSLYTLMAWSGSQEAVQKNFDQVMKNLERENPEEMKNPEMRRLMTELARRAETPRGEFHWYQLLTSALLHEPRLLMPFILHLGGNMLFLLVFGLRVNELIGNWKMAIVYPVLAVASGLADHIAMMNSPLHPGLGASGAIMGLAGMYFIFFPVQHVHMLCWFRGGMLTGWRCLYKLFRMRGFWLLVLWIGLNDGLPMFLNSRDQVAHWAHLGGFLTGCAIAIGLLVSRQVSAMGSDLLSVILGKRAWAIVGKPQAQFA